MSCFSSKFKILVNSFSATERDKFYVKEEDVIQIMVKPWHLLSTCLTSHINLELKILFSRVLWGGEKKEKKQYKNFKIKISFVNNV